MKHRDENRGFTIVELCIAITLMAILFIKLTMIINEASKTHRRETLSMALEDQALLVLDRISYAVIGSDPDTLFPDPEAPFFTDRLEYQVSLGVEDGQVVWSDPEVIGLDDNPSLLYWGRNEGTPGEQVVVWCRTVAEFFANEVPNGDDDNANGLTDETGLSFVLEGTSVTIRLTLERMTKEGPIRHTKETVVTCRN
jgi:prepilin-type N-terminal cleavage/methylation domain-containing protein